MLFNNINFCSFSLKWHVRKMKSWKWQIFNEGRKVCDVHSAQHLSVSSLPKPSISKTITKMYPRQINWKASSKDRHRNSYRFMGSLGGSWQFRFDLSFPTEKICTDGSALPCQCKTYERFVSFEVDCLTFITLKYILLIITFNTEKQLYQLLVSCFIETSTLLKGLPSIPTGPTNH